VESELGHVALSFRPDGAPLLQPRQQATTKRSLSPGQPCGSMCFASPDYLAVQSLADRVTSHSPVPSLADRRT
jgi:hypothetical protein